jgi:REP element-mobilizing transposase RayT
MARQARLDFPGALHHVFTRGVARGAIFVDDRDREVFLRYLGEVLIETGARCYAWSLLSTHFHLVLRTGKVPLGRVMQKLLTRYALYFNRRHHRDGHLFQNRYKAILGQADSYLLELVRYVHLNPVRAGMVGDMAALAAYRWTGHRALLGRGTPDWQDTDLVLAHFGGEPVRARDRYVAYLEEGVKEAPGDFEKRLAEGAVTAVVGAPGAVEGRDPEPRVLGSGRYVEEVLRDVENRDRRRAWLGKRLTPEDVMARAAQAAGVPVEALGGRAKRPAVVRARCLACKWLVEDLGLSGAMVAAMLGITRSGVSKCVGRGGELEKALGIRLDAGVS